MFKKNKKKPPVRLDRQIPGKKEKHDFEFKFFSILTIVAIILAMLVIVC